MKKFILGISIALALLVPVTTNSAMAHAPWKHDEGALKAPTAHFINFLRPKVNGVRESKCLPEFKIGYKNAAHMPVGMREWAEQLWLKRLQIALAKESECLAIPDRVNLLRIAQCETGTNWQHANSTYEGALGFLYSTWDDHAPTHFPDNAQDASPDQQLYVGQILVYKYGWSPWPACSIRLGLR